MIYRSKTVEGETQVWIVDRNGDELTYAAGASESYEGRVAFGANWEFCHLTPAVALEVASALRENALRLAPELAEDCRCKCRPSRAQGLRARVFALRAGVAAGWREFQRQRRPRRPPPGPVLVPLEDSLDRSAQLAWRDLAPGPVRFH